MTATWFNENSPQGDYESQEAALDTVARMLRDHDGLPEGSQLTLEGCPPPVGYASAAWVMCGDQNTGQLIAVR